MTRPLSERTRANRDHWNAFSGPYQDWCREDLEGDLKWGPSMPPEAELRILPDVADRDVLEICCGGGQSAAYLAARGARVTGVDISDAQLAYARRHLAERGLSARFVEANAEDLSALPDAAFDVAFSAYAFGFVEDVGAAFREAFRVLRPGGFFAFSWSSPLFDCTRLEGEERLVVWKAYWDREPLVDEDEFGRSIIFHRTYGDWHRALVAAGFVVTDVVEPEPLAVENAWWEGYPLAKLQQVPGTVIWTAVKPA